MEETITGNEMYRKESRVISLEETNLIFSARHAKKTLSFTMFRTEFRVFKGFQTPKQNTK